MTPTIKEAWRRLYGADWKSHDPLEDVVELSSFASCLVNGLHFSITSIVASLFPREESVANLAASRSIISALCAGSLSPDQKRSRTYQLFKGEVNAAIVSPEDKVHERSGSDVDEPVPQPMDMEFLPVMHLTDTTKCKPDCDDHAEPRSPHKDWDKHYKAVTEGRWPDLCVFLHRSDAHGDSVFYRCDQAAILGAHVKARQRFWIVPSCAKCNRQHGQQMFLDGEVELVCPLPEGCLHEWKNGDSVVVDAKVYPGHIAAAAARRHGH